MSVSYACRCVSFYSLHIFAYSSSLTKRRQKLSQWWELKCRARVREKHTNTRLLILMKACKCRKESTKVICSFSSLDIESLHVSKRNETKSGVSEQQWVWEWERAKLTNANENSNAFLSLKKLEAWLSLSRLCVCRITPPFLNNRFDPIGFHPHPLDSHIENNLFWYTITFARKREQHGKSNG